MELPGKEAEVSKPGKEPSLISLEYCLTGRLPVPTSVFPTVLLNCGDPPWGTSGRGLARDLGFAMLTYLIEREREREREREEREREQEIRSYYKYHYVINKYH